MPRPSRLSEGGHRKIPMGKEGSAVHPLKRLPRKQSPPPLPEKRCDGRKPRHRPSQADVGRGSRAGPATRCLLCGCSEVVKDTFLLEGQQLGLETSREHPEVSVPAISPKPDQRAGRISSTMPGECRSAPIRRPLSIKNTSTLKQRRSFFAKAQSPVRRAVASELRLRAAAD